MMKFLLGVSVGYLLSDIIDEFLKKATDEAKSATEPTPPSDPITPEPPSPPSDPTPQP